MTATAPASSAMRACSGVTTSMMTPPLSISAMPRLTRVGAGLVGSGLDMRRSSLGLGAAGRPGADATRVGPGRSGTDHGRETGRSSVSVTACLVATRTTHTLPAANGSAAPFHENEVAPAAARRLHSPEKATPSRSTSAVPLPVRTTSGVRAPVESRLPLATTSTCWNTTVVAPCWSPLGSRSGVPSVESTHRRCERDHANEIVADGYFVVAIRTGCAAGRERAEGEAHVVRRDAPPARRSSAAGSAMTSYGPRRLRSRR